MFASAIRFTYRYFSMLLSVPEGFLVIFLLFEGSSRVSEGLSDGSKSNMSNKARFLDPGSYLIGESDSGAEKEKEYLH